MKVQDLYFSELLISYDKFINLKKGKPGLNNSDIKALTDQFLAAKKFYDENNIYYYGGLPWPEPEEKAVKKYSYAFAVRVNQFLINVLKPTDPETIVLLTYENENDKRAYEGSLKEFLNTILHLEPKYTREIKDEDNFFFRQINNDGELVRFDLANYLNKKIENIKDIVEGVEDETPDPIPTPGPDPQSPDVKKAAMDLSVWLLREFRNVRQYMVNRYGFALLSEASITMDDFAIMIKKENLELLLSGLEPGQVRYLLDTFVKDNPTNSTALQIRTALTMISVQNMSEDAVYNNVKTLSMLQGVDDNLIRKFAKALKSPPIVIPVLANLPPKSPTPPAAPASGGATPLPPTPPAPTPPSPPTPPTAAGGAPGPSAAPPKISSGPEKMDRAPAGPRTSGDAMSPISPKGGPTYYIRTSPGRYRPAVQADMNANIPLYIKNPNPVAALANQYVRVADEVKKARRAGPVDQRAMDKEMSAQGYQRVGPGGLRREADGSIRRKSKLSGAAGSLSNFLGDVGNTLKKGSR